jgi:hypothetical protein
MEAYMNSGIRKEESRKTDKINGMGEGNTEWRKGRGDKEKNGGGGVE